MPDKRYSDELEHALARHDTDEMIQQLDAYAAYFAAGEGEWTDDFSEIITCHSDDPEKALAYVALGASRSDEPVFLAQLACGPLEDVLRDPSSELLARIVAEARKSARFRWLLSHPFKVAVSDEAWAAIERFRMTGPHEEPSPDSLPPRSS
ncbi:hypothetical protein H9L14_13535 [Sphingomonas sediminicola]|uniref:DUF6869 domain-containing protein n=1 Tax=Sphingomonas sediminicola TaxID=386874 RepID=A0ABX6T806_9SPHN|nr:hypothetical protein [Sphingomonas sediminicola]QNP45556.1 hypothetical protein H9L14_13535 [Sphingomonas sediminicola]